MRSHTQPRIHASNFAPEFARLLALCRLVGQPEADHVAGLLDGDLNWDQWLRMGDTHRVLPLIWSQVRQRRYETRLPDCVVTTLRTTGEENARRNLYLTKQLLSILSAFREHGIAAAPFKGPALAERLYGNVALRQCCDLDIFIHRKDLPEATSVLEAFGLAPSCRLSPRQQQFMIERECELEFSDGRALHIELHWRILPRYYCAPVNSDDFWKRVVTTEFAGGRISELAPEDLLLCLALHARKHYWSKLIWICDIARLLDTHPGLDWGAVFLRAQAAHAERIVLVTLALAHYLFRASLPSWLAAEIEADEAVQELTSSVAKLLLTGLEATSAGPLLYFRFLRCRERWRDRFLQVVRHALTPGIAEWSCSQSCLPVYFPLHVARMTGKASRFAIRMLKA